MPGKVFGCDVGDFAGGVWGCQGSVGNGVGGHAGEGSGSRVEESVRIRVRGSVCGGVGKV